MQFEKERKENSLLKLMTAFETKISSSFTYDAVSKYISDNNLTTEAPDGGDEDEES